MFTSNCEVEKRVESREKNETKYADGVMCACVCVYGRREKTALGNEETERKTQQQQQQQ